MKSKLRKGISPRERELVYALYNKGNSTETISEFLDIPAPQVDHIIKAYDPTKQPFNRFKTKLQEEREQIGEFERILKKKKNSSEIGSRLWENLKARHTDYKDSWEADSIIKLNLPEAFTCIALIADFHIGHEGVDYAALEKDIKILDRTPGMYAGFLGDAIDNFIDVDKHKEAVINSVAPPKDQLYMLTHLLSMLKKPKSKILFVTKDNHVTERLKKACGIDWSNKMWSDYGIFYGGEEINAYLNIGGEKGVQYKLAARHKFPGGSKIHLTAGAKNLLKTGPDGDADIVALGHKHEGAIEHFTYRGIPRIAAQSSTYKLFDPYSASCGFNRPVIFMPCVVLNPFTKGYQICSSLEEGSLLVTSLNKNIAEIRKHYGKQK